MHHLYHDSNFLIYHDLQLKMTHVSYIYYQIIVNNYLEIVDE
jgi:hypothetical protein